VRLALTLTAASMATSAIGRTVAMRFASASATELRRRLAWRAQAERSVPGELVRGPKHWD